MRLEAVVAVSDNDIIGADGGLPWHLPADLRRFRRLTEGHAVMMGARTFASIAGRLGRPLPRRFSIVLSTTASYAGVRTARTVGEALAIAEEYSRASQLDSAFVIGGTSVYRQFLSATSVVHLTRVHIQCAGDARFPSEWLNDFETTEHEAGRELDGTCYTFLRYERKV